MDAAVFESAQNIAQRYARQYGLRSLDILHLATAVRHGITSFGSFDDRQSDAAQALGLNVFRA
jgi:predicted nucleic acid-binding protein